MRGLLSTITQSDDFAQLLSGLRRGLAEQAVVGLVGSQKASYVAGLYTEVKGSPQLKKGPLFVITYTIYRAE